MDSTGLSFRKGSSKEGEFGTFARNDGLRRVSYPRLSFFQAIDLLSLVVLLVAAGLAI